ncbi:MAG: hypothetical protein GTO18_14650 [Anaerolineales bacterium]|nr:hypothetical protein [Anaerolineales bacterium]
MSQSTRIAAVQMKCTTGDVDWNLERSIELIHEAARGGVDVVCFPESVLDGYACADDDLPEFARPVPGPETEAIAALARDLEIWILWSMAELVGDGVANTALLFDRQGTMRIHYRKVHLCREQKEDIAYVPGNAFYVTPSEGLTLGVMVCFDRHFPEVARALRLRGAELILHPSATVWFTPDSKSLNTAMMRTRAYENQCFILSVNQANYGGGSALFGPWGEVMAVAGSEEEILYLELNSELLSTPPETHFDLLSQRRAEIYKVVNR